MEGWNEHPQMTRFEIDAERRTNRRLARDEKMWEREEVRWNRDAERREKAESMVGHLLSGRFYTYPVGGKYVESASKSELVALLLKGRFV